MTRTLRALIECRSANAAAEMALVLPFLLALLFGSIELGNYFLNEHAIAKQVRDGARYGSRLPLAADFSCPGTVWDDAGAQTAITNVTKTGKVAGGTSYRRPFSATDVACTGSPATVNVTVRCVDADDYAGVWSGLDGDIPVLKVEGAIKYKSILSNLGFISNSICVRAESEAPIAGA